MARGIGEILQDMGFVDEAEIKEALRIQDDKGGKLGDILIELGYVSEPDVLFALAEQTGMEVADLDEEEIDAAVIEMVPKTFAETYRGRIIEFDGNIAAMNRHGDSETRFDILLYAGDYSETVAIGPAIQFRDVNYQDLHLTGPNAPDSVGQGINLHITAEVGEYEAGSCLFLLNPVSTEVR